MNLIDVLPDIGGMYLLTHRGDLGYYQSDQTFAWDAALGRELKAPIADFLADYKSTQDTSDYRIGIIHAGNVGRPWHSATMAITDAVLRNLYPSHGGKAEKLTSFQERNREHSLFRAIELLLDYRKPGLSQKQYYYPLLVFRNTRVKDYTACGAGLTAAENQNEIVVEVIDLLAKVPATQRSGYTTNKLIDSIRKRVICRDKRKQERLVLIDDLRDSVYAWSNEASAKDPYAAEDQREILDLASLLDKKNNGFDYQRCLHDNCETEARILMGHCLREPYVYKEADELRIFDQFQNLDNEALTTLAQKSPVFTVPAGTHLLNHGSIDNWNLYLLSGALELEAADGRRKVITGGTPSARKAIAMLKPRIYNVTSLSKVQFLWIYKPMTAAVQHLAAGRARYHLQQAAQHA